MIRALDRSTFVDCCIARLRVRRAACIIKFANGDVSILAMALMMMSSTLIIHSMPRDVFPLLPCEFDDSSSIFMQKQSFLLHETNVNYCFL